jgi:hypothetical protein
MVADASVSPVDGDAPPMQLGKCRGLWTGIFALLNLLVEELARQLTIWNSPHYCATQKQSCLNAHRTHKEATLKGRAQNSGRKLHRILSVETRHYSFVMGR